MPSTAAVTFLFSDAIALSAAMMAAFAPPLLLSLIEHLPRVCYCYFHCDFSLIFIRYNVLSHDQRHIGAYLIGVAEML